MAAITAATVLTSLAVSAVMTGAKMGLQALLAPQQQSFGGSLSQATRRDPGREITLPKPNAVHQIIVGEHRVQGDIVFRHVTQNNYLGHFIVVWAGHEVESLGALYFDDEAIPYSGGVVGGRYAGYVGCDDHYGSPDQLANSNLIFHAPELWGPNHRLRGRAYSYITLHNMPELFPHGVPNFWRVAKGMKVYDPRIDATVWTDNASLITVGAGLAHPDYALGCSYDEIATAALIAAANADDEPVALASGGTEKRYRANGIWRSDEPPVDVIPKLLSANVGRLVLSGGKWVIRSGVWYEPDLPVFSEKHFRAGFTLRNLLGAQESFTGAKGTFRNPAKLWQPDDFPAVTSETYDAAAGGERKLKDLAFDFTTSATQAQRAARIDTRKGQQPLSFTAPFNLTGVLIEAGDNVPLDDDLFGWSAKPFEAIEVRFVFGQANGKGPMGVIGVDVDLRETAPEIFDDSIDEEIEGDVAPNTTLPDYFRVMPPSNLEVVESKYVTRDGLGVKAKATLSWDASPDAVVQFGGWYGAEFRLQGAPAWTKLETTTALSIEILDMEPGLYEFRVRSFNRIGAPTTTPPLITQPITGLSDIPATPVNLSLQTVGGGTLAELHWDRSPDIDVLVGGKVVFRHSHLLEAATWADGVSFGLPQPGNLTGALLPARTGTIMMKFQDGSGNYSAGFATVVCRQGGMLEFTTLASIIEHPAFSGTKVGVFVDETGTLMIAGSDDFDAVPDVDALVSWDFPAGVRVGSDGYYDFATVLDLGTVQHCRLTALIEAQVRNLLDDFDSRTTDSDTWPSWDGDVVGDEADGALFVQTTSDDPASPGAVWSAWNRLDASEHHIRGARFRFVPATRDPNFNLATAGLGIVAEAVV